MAKRLVVKLARTLDQGPYQVGEFVRGGGFRDTFECASDTTKLLKFDRYVAGSRKVKSRGKMKDLFRAMRSRLGYKKQRLSGNQDELLGWQQIQDAGLAEHKAFARVFGMVETDRGPALLTEKVDNFRDDEIRSVKDYITRFGRIEDESLIHALREYFRLLRLHHISCFGDRPENMGIVCEPDGEIYIKCFDVKPYLDHQLIPLHKLEFFRKRRIERRLDRHFDNLSGKRENAD